MSNDHPALKKTYLKSTIHGDGNIIIFLTTFILLEQQEAIPLTAFVSVFPTQFASLWCHFCAGKDGSFEQEEKP